MVTNPRKIAANYIKGWFVIDAIAAVPFDLLLFSTGTSDVRIYIFIYLFIYLNQAARSIKHIKQQAHHNENKTE